MKIIYMDHNATTPLDAEVLEAMMPYLTDKFGNPSSSTHAYGWEARRAVDEARSQVAELIGAHPEEIVFTSGATEADNLAIKGVARAHRDRGNHIITSQVEHKAVLETCKSLEKEGFKVTYLPVDRYGMVDPEEVRRAITDKTILISIMYVNSEVGTIEPVESIGEIAREKGVLFHSDAVQGAGKIETKVDKLKTDLLAISGHKMYGPKGIGALYLKKGVKIEPLLYGGGHEKGLRAGTENVPGIVGFGKACQKASRVMEEEAKRLTKLRNRLYQGIMNKIKRVYLNGHPKKRLPGNLNLSFEFVEGESLILSIKNFAISSGSACTSSSLKSSYVLLAMKVPEALCHCSLRICLGRSNTEEEVDYLVEELSKNVARLREMSPLYKEV